MIHSSSLYILITSEFFYQFICYKYPLLFHNLSFHSFYCTFWVTEVPHFNVDKSINLFLHDQYFLYLKKSVPTCKSWRYSPPVLSSKIYLSFPFTYKYYLQFIFLYHTEYISQIIFSSIWIPNIPSIGNKNCVLKKSTLFPLLWYTTSVISHLSRYARILWGDICFSYLSIFPSLHQ